MSLSDLPRLSLAALLMGLSLGVAGCQGDGRSGGSHNNGSSDTDPNDPNSPPSNYPPASAEDSWSGGAQVFPVSVTGPAALSYTLDLGANTGDIFFIFTNPSLTSAAAQPTVSDILPGPPASLVATTVARPPDPTPAALRDIPWVQAFNADPANRSQPRGGGRYALGTSGTVRLDAVNDTGTFSVPTLTSGCSSVPATARLVRSVPDTTFGAKTLNVWVGNNAYDSGSGCSKASCIDPTMVTALADAFLLAGPANDVYDWVTDIYGEEWGPPDPSYPWPVLAPNHEITILLFDIGADNSTNGGAAGVFFNKDNAPLNTNFGAGCISNGRVMFYLDSVLFATGDDPGPWQSTDFWPRELLATLGHEFQHMIHFYQKEVFRNGEISETWLDEMASEVTEDLIADKLGVPGPRGVEPPTDYTGGSPPITSGRLPLFDYYDDDPVAAWFSGNDVLRSYSVNYAFGAFLARNCGGALLFRDVVQRVEGNSMAITAALADSTACTGETFATLLRAWGPAVLLSDDPAGPLSYVYNRGGVFSSSSGTDTYNLGSINLYNYEYPYWPYSGPYLYTTSPVGFWLQPPATSNLYYLAGQRLTVVQTWSIGLPGPLELTVVVRP